MLRASLLGLGVGTLFATAAAMNGAGPFEAAPILEPRPALLALGGGMVDLVAEQHGPGCFAPMLDELRRHPRWTIRIDDLEWDDVVGNEPDERHAMLVIDADTATWRDGALPQSLTLTGQERRDVLAAFALDCRVDESLPYGGFAGHYIGIALGEDGPPVAELPTNSPVAVRVLELLQTIRARYIAGRADDLRGFSIDLAGVWRANSDDQGRPLYEPHRIAYPLPAPAPVPDLEDRVRLLDWAMTQPTSLPASKHVARGILRAYGTSRPIAVHLRNLGPWHTYHAFAELPMWASIAHPTDDDP